MQYSSTFLPEIITLVSSANNITLYCCTSEQNADSVANTVSGDDSIWESTERGGNCDCHHKLLQSPKSTCSYGASCPWCAQGPGRWCHITILGELRRLVCVILLGEFKMCIILYFRVSVKSSVSWHFCVSATLAAAILYSWVSCYII
jgi:hypothetical protein